jgi:hypothetical protein
MTTTTPGTPAHEAAHAAMRRHNRSHPDALVVEVEGPQEGERTFLPLAEAIEGGFLYSWAR